MNLKDNLMKSLNNVGNAKGIVCLENDEHELGFRGRCVDDYLATSVLAELIKDNKIELIFKVGKKDKRMEYFLRLLKVDNPELLDKGE